MSNSWSALALPPLLFLIKNTAATAPPAPPTGSRSIGKVVSSWTRLAFPLALFTACGCALTVTVKLRVFASIPSEEIVARISTFPVVLGRKIATEDP